MSYKVSDEQFYKELEINAYCNQIKGYIVGYPKRMDFKPIVPVISGDIPVFDGGPGKYIINRERTLDGPAYTFTDEEKAILLAEKP